MRNARWLSVAVGVAALSVLVLSSCSSGPEPTGPGTATPSAAESEPTRPTPTSIAGIDPVDIRVEDGEIIGPSQISVEQGDLVALRIETDVEDEIHVHGYELKFDTSPGEKVPVGFEATIPGIFEIELENAGLLITQLKVNA